MKCVRCVAAIPSSADTAERDEAPFDDPDDGFPNMSDVGGGGGGGGSAAGSRAEEVGVLWKGGGYC